MSEYLFNGTLNSRQQRVLDEAKKLLPPLIDDKDVHVSFATRPVPRLDLGDTVDETGKVIYRVVAITYGSRQLAERIAGLPPSEIGLPSGKHPLVDEFINRFHPDSA